ncbi:MAG: Holliday junction resolvase RuvX [Dehalococcoidales bacterium]|nr:Holliday junction resolvase RuvX [Dehalococcoidales bacterium]
MGLDVGDKRIGVALGDPTGWIASSLTVITRTSLKRDVQIIGELAKEHEVQKIIVGLPRRMDGTLGEQAQKAQAFGRELERRLGLPVVFWDERLTTVAAEKMMIGAGVRREKRRERIDAVAASLMLQSYLDFQRSRTRTFDGIPPYED